MICRITSGLLFACSQKTVPCTETHIHFRTVDPVRRSHKLRTVKADWQMKFNVAKWHSMRVTRISITNNVFDYSLQNQTYEIVKSAKPSLITLVGVNTSLIFSKATKTLGFLRRNLAITTERTARKVHTKLSQLLSWWRVIRRVEADC